MTVAGFVLLLGINPRDWAKKSASDRARVKQDVEAWFRDMEASGVMRNHLRFDTWKEARTISITDGSAKDAGDEGVPKPPLATFKVNRINEEIARLRDNGFEIPDARNEGWGTATRFLDPSGNKICLFEAPETLR